MIQKILLIDDDSVLNYIHTKIVCSKFPNTPIITFENGQEALDYIKNNPTNKYLIFLDINMPIMDGWEFIEAISPTNQFNLEIHILTSSIDKFDKDKASEMNEISSYIVKPLTKDIIENLNSE